MKLALQIAAGIIIAAALLSLGSFAVTIGTAYWAKQQLEEKAEAQRAEHLEKQRQAALASQAQAEQQKQAEERAKAAKIAEQIRSQREHELNNAFEDQYVPPPGCQNPQSDSQWVKCVDTKRAARQAFLTNQVDNQLIRVDE